MEFCGVQKKYDNIEVERSRAQVDIFVIFDGGIFIVANPFCDFTFIYNY